MQVLVLILKKYTFYCCLVLVMLFSFYLNTVNERLHVIKDSNCGDYRNICDDIRLCMSIRVVYSIRCVAYDLVAGTL
ncbi:hypothetical protein TrispH2_002419 [Trichoplax sp. H2]|nr:hypothetical protein TrispH2_002419 [Trichoplax sp. H2]|eukprot:RDD44925.1 hypothetical protein TrispH2_002419 [Trichoplax sp. H2]